MCLCVWHKIGSYHPSFSGKSVLLEPLHQRKVEAVAGICVLRSVDVAIDKARDQEPLQPLHITTVFNPTGESCHDVLPRFVGLICLPVNHSGDRPATVDTLPAALPPPLHTYTHCHTTD